MKLSLIFPLFVLLALVQNMDARPYPEDSSSWSSWFSYPVSSVFGGYFNRQDISKESTDLLSQGTKLAHQVLDVINYVPGLQPVYLYGKVGLKVADYVGETAKRAVSMFQKREKSVQKRSFDLGSYFPNIAKATEKINSGIKTVLETIKKMLERITVSFRIF
uniref:Putative salivary secreted protein n=1 Tax=Panstrongylus lignarius TaxID=156445 RepID=A0A224XMM7_9HEMI